MFPIFPHTAKARLERKRSPTCVKPCGVISKPGASRTLSLACRKRKPAGRLGPGSIDAWVGCPASPGSRWRSCLSDWAFGRVRGSRGAPFLSMRMPATRVGSLRGRRIPLDQRINRDIILALPYLRSPTPGQIRVLRPPGGSCSPAGGTTTLSVGITNYGSPSAAAPATTACGPSTPAKESPAASNAANEKRPSARCRSPKSSPMRIAWKRQRNAGRDGRR